MPRPGGVPENLKPAKKGEVRNPKGGKSGPHFKTVLSELLNAPIPPDSIEDGIKQHFEEKLGRKLSIREGLMISLVVKGMSGDIQAIKEALDRIDGKVTQGFDHTTKGEAIQDPEIVKAEVEKAMRVINEYNRGE